MEVYHATSNVIDPPQIVLGTPLSHSLPLPITALQLQGATFAHQPAFEMAQLMQYYLASI